MSNIQWEYIFNPELALESIPYVLSGLPYTLGIALISAIFGLMIGLVLASMRISNIKVLNIIARAYISFMRGTPTLVLLFILYFGLPFMNVQLPAVTASIIGFSVNSAAYIAEIIRSSISSVDPGQWEAGYAVGLNWGTIMSKIVLPQAWRIAVPPLSNTLLDIIKGTSLTAMITVPEMFQNAKIVGGREYDYMTMYILVALIYWALCSLFGIFQKYLEEKTSVYV
ncbi:amino acid ABC transporter permease [Alloiococcus otitis]|uniref:amino acid ABC transporter permease n=1 Tax=Alloiococcus otitis TaxID=1652 RepID=UPI002355C993|nr:amino acid ABC transporter permease [Alloiococcus otitis]